MPIVGVALDYSERSVEIVHRIFRHVFFIATITPAFVCAQINAPRKPSVDSKRKFFIDLKHALEQATPCRTFQQRIQFLTETSLLLLSGPSGDCYRSVNQIALNVISTDGHLLARKPWPSTDPGIVIDGGRLLLARLDGLEVEDKSLTTIQLLELPPHRFMSSMQRTDEQGTVVVSLDGRDYIYGGTPLAMLSQGQPSQRGTTKKLFSFANGQTITKDGEVLNLEGDGQATKKIASLDWVLPDCERYMYCQAYAPVSIQVSAGRKQRVLVYSNGSKFPITDAAGLFPYFRLQVFDVATGVELYREENVVRTGDRGAALSPDGDWLATTDGQRVVVLKLQ